MAKRYTDEFRRDAVPSRFRSLPHARAKTHFVQFKSEALRGINTALLYFSLVFTTALP
jgi:hypothetical protein